MSKKRILHKKNSFLFVLFSGLFILTSNLAFGDNLPSGADVKVGNPSIATDGGDMTVDANGHSKTWVDWQGGFNIGKDNLVDNLGPSRAAAILHNDISGNISQIQGALSGNCNVFLLNSKGVLFSPTAQVNVGSLVASSLKMSQEDFRNGNYVLTADGQALGTVINKGNISALNDGSVTLAGGAVKNLGTIDVNLGTVNLVSGSQVTLDVAGNGNIQAAVDQGLLGEVEVYDQDGNKVETGVENIGEITANGGKIYMEADAVSGVFDKLVNQEGVVRAGSLVEENGQIVLRSDSEGIVQNTGTMTVSGVEDGASGGQVKVLGENVRLVGDSLIDASGDTDGGIIEVGGNYQGQGPDRSSLLTVVGKDVEIKANAGQIGTGGEVIIWSDGGTYFLGDISTKGGSISGDGGFVEVSGKENLIFYGNVTADAVNGSTGTLLLDPADITVYDGSDGLADLTLPTVNEGDAGSETNQDSLEVLGAVDILLEASGDITINDLSGDNTLDLSDSTSLTIHANWDLGGSGNFSMNSGDTISVGGAITIYGDNVTTGGLTSTGSGVTLGGVDNSAPGDILVSGAINTGGGDFTVTYNNAGGDQATTFTNNASITTGGGAVDIQTTGAVDINDTITTTGAETGDIDIDGNGSGVASLDINSAINAGGYINLDVSAGTITLDDNLTAVENIDINDALTLTDNSVITSSDGNITFSTITGSSNDDLTVTANSGTVTLSGSVGASSQINDIDIDANTLTQNGTIEGQNNITIDVTTALIIDETITSNGTGDIDITSTGGGMTFSDAVTSADNVTIVASGDIENDADSVITADTISITNNGDTSTIGTVTGTDPLISSPFYIDAATLDASTTQGHIIIRDTADDIAIDADAGGVTTNSDKGDSDATRAIVRAVGGVITGTGTGVHVNAWTANLVTMEDTDNSIYGGAIGTSSTPIQTDVSVLNATADSGGIYINQNDGTGTDVDIILGDITAKYEGSIPRKSEEGLIVIDELDNTSSFDIEITAEAGVFMGGAVQAPDDLTVTAVDEIVDSNDGNDFLAADLILDAGGDTGDDLGIGQSGNHLDMLVERVDATCDNHGVYLTEGMGTTVESITSSGTSNDVEVTASTGNLVLKQIDASDTADATVTLESSDGTITDNNGGTVNILTSGSDGTAVITADEGIGDSNYAGGEYIDTTVGILQATMETADSAPIYITNGNADLSSITVDTENSDVDIRYDEDDTDKTLSFSSNDLSIDDSGLATLDFENTGGRIDLNGVTVSMDLTIEASTSIDQEAGTIAATTGTLTAGEDIGSGTPIETDLGTLTATTTNGAIYISEADALTLTATSAGTTKDIVASNDSGDMTINAITATGAVTLTAEEDLLDGNGATNNVSGTAATLEATTGAIGESAGPDLIETEVAGAIDTEASTGVYLTNTGDVTEFNATDPDDTSAVGGDVTFTNTGSLEIADLFAGANTVTLTISGDVTDFDSGADNNITAGALTVDAKSFGTSGDNIETDVTTFSSVATTSGGIYIEDTDGNVTITSLEALGSEADISFTSDGDMDLSAIIAEGDTVTLNSGGAITDGNAGSMNVTAYTLNITAAGSVDELETSISKMTGSGSTSGGLAVTNNKPIKVTATTLSGEDTTITADDITIFDNGGGLTVTGGGDLTLTANYGDIVFLNMSDTIQTAGDISFTARYDGDVDDASVPARIDNALPARIIVGNLTSDTGNITLEAYSDVTLGKLTATSGNVNIYAADDGGADYGLILDGNGATDNIETNVATLYAKMHTSAKAETDRENAIARYEAAVATANSNGSLKETWESNYNDYVNLVASALTVKNNAQTTYDTDLATFNSADSDLESANDTMDGLEIARTAAQVVKDAAAFVTGAAQAVPFSGDGGADAVFATVDVAFSIADAAMLAYEESTVEPAEDAYTAALSDLDIATSNLESAVNDYNNLVSQQNAANNSLSIAESAYNASVIAREHAQAVRTQALASDSATEAIGSDANTGASGELEINAGTVSVTTAGDVTTGPAASALTNATDVTLSTVGNIDITNANSSGTATVDLQTDSDINYTQTGDQDTEITNLTTDISGDSDSTITVDVNGEIYGSDNSSADVVGPNINLTAASVGQTGELEINATSSLTVDTSASDGNITIEDTLGDLPLGTINADTGNVTFTNSTGEIYDSASDSTTDITATDLSLTAGTGIGSSASLETEVSGVFAATTVTGDISNYNTGSLEIGTIGSVEGVTITGGGADDDIFIHASSPLTVSTPTSQTGGGDITLIADGTTLADDLTINNTVTASGGNGNIYLYAGDVITQGDYAITAAGSGTINYYAGVDYNGGSPQAGLAAGTSDITMSASATATSTSGAITMTAPQDIALGALSTSGNVSVTADDSTYDLDDSTGAITDNLGAETENITASLATLRAATGIGSSDDIETNITTLDALNSTSGDIVIYELLAGTDLNINRAIQQTADGVDIQTHNGTLTVAASQSGVTAAGVGTVVLTAGDSDSDEAEDLVVNDTVASGSGKITLTSSGENVTFGAGGDVTSTSGEVEVNAVNDDGDGAITMADGAVFNAGSGIIDLNADANVSIGSLVTTDSSNSAVTIDSAEGALSDAGDTDVDIVANSGRAVINAITGVGSADDIETTVSSIDIDNTTSGNIQIDETDAITVVKAVQSGTGNISIVADGTITADSSGNPANVIGATASSGTITIDADGTSSGIVVNDGIANGTGTITLTADDDVTFAADGDITSTFGAMSITADADSVADGSSGALTMVDKTLIDAGSSTLTLSADEDITLGGLLTTDATGSAATITSTSGAIVDGGDTHTDIDADSAGAVVTIDAVTGVGSADALETEVATINIDNAPPTGSDATGNIQISEVDTANGGLIVQKAVQGDVGVEATNTGNINISSVDGLLNITGPVTARDGGTITIDANDAGDNESFSFTIGDVVTSSVGLKDVGVGVVTAGGITLSADYDIDVNAKISTANANADYTANGDIFLTTDAGQLGDIRIGNEIEVVDEGSITITAEVDIDFDTVDGLLDTTQTTTGANATLTARDGSIIETYNDSGGSTVDIQANTITLNAENGAIGQAAGEDIDIDSVVSVSADTSTGGGDITLNETSGNLPVALIDAGAGDVTLTSASGITDTDADTASDIIAAALYLEAEGDVGADGSNQELDTEVATVDDRSATENVNGSIYIVENDAVNLGSLNGLTTDTGDIDITAANSAAGDMTATSVTAGGDGNVLLITENGSSDTNDISVGSITAADDDVSLVADAAITDADATTAVDITSNALYLQTGTSVGVDVAGQYLDTRVATIDDYTGGTVGTNLYIREYDGVTLGSLNSTTGLSTTDGEIKITAANSDAGALTASVLTAGGSNNDIYLTTADGGSDTNDIAMGLVTAADDDVWLDSDYDITDADADSASDVVASGLYLDALHSVGASGSSQELDTTVATIDDYSSTRNVTEDIYIIETDAVTLGSINSLTTDNGLIDIDAGGTITVNVVTANTAVHLYATAGDILDNTTGTTLITAGADSSLKASGVIGSAVGPHDPVDVDIDGELWVGADSEENEVSAILQGTVNTSASTERVEIYKPSPPGLVIFDNHLMGGGNYGSGSTGGSILSQGYGTTTVALTTMFDVYPQSALQGWGYPISQGALINEDLLTGPSAGIDGSELGITGIPNNLIIPVHETSMPQFYIIRAP